MLIYFIYLYNINAKIQNNYILKYFKLYSKIIRLYLVLFLIKNGWIDVKKQTNKEGY